MSSVDIEQAMFQPFPSEIYFQCFEPFQTYEVPLQLRNNDRVYFDDTISIVCICNEVIFVFTILAV